MSIEEFELMGCWRRSDRHLACIRTTAGLTVLAEMSDPVTALLFGKAEALNQVVSGACPDLISVEVLNSDGEIVLGEMAEDLEDSRRPRLALISLGDEIP